MGEYWQRRKRAPYYRISIQLAKKYAPEAKSVLDVGGRDCEYILWCEWVPTKVMIELHPFEIPGVEVIHADFLKHQFQEPFDLVLCMQVLEHLEDPTPFAQRLLEVGRTVVVSVPDRWPVGKCEHHPQDPVNEEKLDGWMGQKPIERIHANSRIMAVYR